MTDRETARTGFVAGSGWGDAARTAVAGDASARQYFRLTRNSGETAILMDAPPELGESTKPFIRIDEHLLGVGLSAPRIYHADTDQGFLLLEDFGTQQYAKLMADDPALQLPLYREAADVLLHLAQVPAPDLAVCDADWLVDMLEPLFTWYAPENADLHAVFAKAFVPFAEKVASGRKILMLRDYHAENLFLLPDRAGIRRVGLIDFQDAMLAHPAYDLVSILQDARRDVSAELEAAILQHYLRHSDTGPDRFRRHYAILGLQRNLRILGIFARLCLRDGKAHYLQFMPRVWDYVQRNLAQPGLEPLAKVLRDDLPAPTKDFLMDLRRRCPTPPSQP